MMLQTSARKGSEVIGNSKIVEFSRNNSSNGRVRRCRSLGGANLKRTSPTNICIMCNEKDQSQCARGVRGKVDLQFSRGNSRKWKNVASSIFI